MKRSTNSAPDASSTSYLIGSAFIWISMMTLNSAGARSPGVTLCRLMVGFSGSSFRRGKTRILRAAHDVVLAPAEHVPAHRYPCCTAGKHRDGRQGHPLACPSRPPPRSHAFEPFPERRV